MTQSQATILAHVSIIIDQTWVVRAVSRWCWYFEL